MELKIIRSGENVALDGDSYKPTGCASCHEIVPVGDLMLLIDDREYFPTFCVRCVASIVRKLGGQK